MKVVLDLMIRNLVDYPDDVYIKELNGEISVVYEVKVAEDDMGKVIGKQGRVARAVRAIMKSIASKEDKKVTIEFID